MSTETNSNGIAARHSSETNEHHTPTSIVHPAQVTLGGVDLDPSSCEVANRRIGATVFYSRERGENGFACPWVGRVFMNPPGGHVDKLGRAVIKATGKRGPCTETGDCGLPPGHSHDGCESSQKAAWFKLMREAAARRTTAAIVVCFSVEMLQTTQVNPTGPIPLEFPICYPSRRVAYLRADGTPGTSPPHSSCVILVPPEYDLGGAKMVDRFRNAFAPVGHVVVPS